MSVSVTAIRGNAGNNKFYLTRQRNLAHINKYTTNLHNYPTQVWTDMTSDTIYIHLLMAVQKSTRQLIILPEGSIPNFDHVLYFNTVEYTIIWHQLFFYTGLIKTINRTHLIWYNNHNMIFDCIVQTISTALIIIIININNLLYNHLPTCHAKQLPDFLCTRQYWKQILIMIFILFSRVKIKILYYTILSPTAN